MEKQFGSIVTSVLLALTFGCWLTAMVAPGWFLIEIKTSSSSSSLTVSSISPTTFQKLKKQKQKKEKQALQSQSKNYYFMNEVSGFRLG